MERGNSIVGQLDLQEEDLAVKLFYVAELLTVEYYGACIFIKGEVVV